jgi:UDP-glucose 4-epimerase
MLHWFDQLHGIKSVCLRYFNASGADPQGRAGEEHEPETHLIPLLFRAVKTGEPVTLFGDDYATPDGTCIRDYIHVADLVGAHSAALAYLRGGGASITLNCGYGRGFSVLDVIDTVKRVSGVDFAVETAPRRAGDPAQIIAASERIRAVLGWRPQFDDIATIARHALEWERRLAARGRAA